MLLCMWDPTVACSMSNNTSELNISSCNHSCKTLGYPMRSATLEVWGNAMFLSMCQANLCLLMLEDCRTYCNCV